MKRLYSVALGAVLTVSPMAIPAESSSQSVEHVSNVTLDITSQGNEIEITPSGICLNKACP